MQSATKTSPTAAPGSWLQNTPFYVLVFGVFALYAGAVRLTTFHDDIFNILHIAGNNAISIFGWQSAIGTLHYRPMSFLPWLLIRDWFGWFRPDMLHLINVWAHVLATALVVALAQRIGRRTSLRGVAFPFVAGLFFGLFPFTYQAVLWAGALPHPLMTVFGLAGCLAYLSAYDQTRPRKWLLLCSALLLLAACLSHEQGFTFGLFLPALDILLPRRSDRRWPRPSGIVLAALMLGYAVFTTLVLPAWFDTPQNPSPVMDMRSVMLNIAYHAQGMVVWLLLPLRAVIGLQQFPIPLPLALLVPTVVLLLALLAWKRQFALGLYCLGWWVVSISLTGFFMNSQYVLTGSRLMYAGAVGIALLYAAVLVLLVRWFGWRVITLALLTGTVLLCLWCANYILDWMSELERFTVALRQVDADLHNSDPAARVLLVNMPWWMAPAFPTFPIGSEEMPLFQEGGVPGWSMVASVNNTRRDTTYLFHAPSFQLGSRYNYGVAGPKTDDVGLRAAILQANYVYRFTYTPPGIRVSRLAIVEPEPSFVPPLVRLQRDKAVVNIDDAQVYTCPGKLVLDVTWSGVSGLQEPVGVFVHGLNGQRQQVLVADLDPVGGAFPLDAMPATVSIRDRREIPLPAGIELAQLQVGVYSRKDGQRYQATSSAAVMLADNALVLPIDLRGSMQGSSTICGVN